MTTDYRAMCAELVDDLEMSDWPSKLKEAFRADIARARALLAQPVAEGPTDEELMSFAPQTRRPSQRGPCPSRSRPRPRQFAERHVRLWLSGRRPRPRRSR
jgi:hypothetical protein